MKFPELLRLHFLSLMLLKRIAKPLISPATVGQSSCGVFYFCRNAACIYLSNKVRGFLHSAVACQSEQHGWRRVEEKWQKTTTSSDRRLPASSVRRKWAWRDDSAGFDLCHHPPDFLTPPPSPSGLLQLVKAEFFFAPKPPPREFLNECIPSLVMSHRSPPPMTLAFSALQSVLDFCSAVMFAPATPAARSQNKNTVRVRQGRPWRLPWGAAARSSTNAGLQIIACHGQRGWGGCWPNAPQQEMELPSSPLCCHNPLTHQFSSTDTGWLMETRTRRFTPPWPAARPGPAVKKNNLWDSSAGSWRPPCQKMLWSSGTWVQIGWDFGKQSFQSCKPAGHN